MRLLLFDSARPKRWLSGLDRIDQSGAGSTRPVYRIKERLGGLEGSIVGINFDVTSSPNPSTHSEYAKTALLRVTLFFIARGGP